MSAVAVRTDEQLVFALRRGDESAFAGLVESYGSSLLRLAMVYVRNRAVAEEVVQETWLAVLAGIERFEGRSLLKTWIFRILTNQAKTRAVQEGRSVPLSSLEDDDGMPSVEPSRFDATGHWCSAPRRWDGIPEERLLASETMGVVSAAIAELPTAQAQVIILRDAEGWGPEDTCELLGISEGNQRVLLHRARSKVRAALERHLDDPTV